MQAIVLVAFWSTNSQKNSFTELSLNWTEITALAEGCPHWWRSHPFSRELRFKVWCQELLYTREYRWSINTYSRAQNLSQSYAIEVIFNRMQRMVNKKKTVLSGIFSLAEQPQSVYAHTGYTPLKKYMPQARCTILDGLPRRQRSMDFICPYKCSLWCYSWILWVPYSYDTRVDVPIRPWQLLYRFTVKHLFI